MNVQTGVDAVRQPNEPEIHGRLVRSGNWRRGAIVVALLVIAGVIGARLLGRARAPAGPPPPAAVTVAMLIARDVTEWDDYVGRFEPSQTVEIRPRVSGAVTALHFRDGDIVHRGQPLFTIDQRPFLAAEAEARANLASAQSALALARSDFGRAARLTGDDAISAGEVDALRARVQAGVAGVAAAAARLRERSLDVEFTQVRSPIGGRISDRRVDIGNLVVGGEGAGATLLTTVNAVDPIYFGFDASEALFLKAQRARKAGVLPAVQIRLQDETDYRWKGKLDFTDNGLDPRSGTIRVRATLANPDGFLTTGMFGNMRLASGGSVHALLVPDAAIQTDQVRKTVLVVGRDGIVATKPVVLGPVIGGLRIIRSGLASNDRIIIAGMQGAMPGSKVDAHLGQIAPAAAAGDNDAADAPLAAQATFTR